jgi:hypothetical protein
MEKYLEIVEIVEDETINMPQMIRVEVSDKEEAIAKASDYIGVFEGKEYKIQYHEHYHEEGFSCKIEVINLNEPTPEEI